MRSMLKTLLNVLALLLAAPLAVPVRLTAALDRHDRIFQFGSQTVSLLPGLPGDLIRRGYYSIVLGSYLGSLTMNFGSIMAQRGTEVGASVYIGAFCNLGLCRIGDNVLIGSNVVVASPKAHYFDDPAAPIGHQGGEFERIDIGSGAWIGNGAVVLNRVGSGAVVAAGSVVVKPCEEHGIYAGNPAKLIRFRGARQASG